jgi:DNA gyrase subunit A
MDTKAEDAVSDLFVASAHTLLMIFTDRGQVYPLKVWQLPQSGLTSRGKAIVNLIPLHEGESIRSIVSVDDLDRQDRWLIFATRKGICKRTRLDQYRNVRNSGIRAINLDDDDDLIGVKMADETSVIILVTARGQSIVYKNADVRSVGRATRGVRGIRLRDEDTVVAMDVYTDEPGNSPWTDETPEGEVDDSADDVEVVAEEEVDGEGIEGEDAEETIEEGEPTVLLITVNGYGKRVRLNQFRLQRRGGLGLRALPYVERNGPLVDMTRVFQGQDLMVVTDGGTIIRLPVDQVNTYSRYAKGVRIIKPSDGEHVVSIHPVEADSEEDLDFDEEGAEPGVFGEEAEGSAEGSDPAEGADEASEPAEGTDTDADPEA